jgi:hypothetical protein
LSLASAKFKTEGASINCNGTLGIAAKLKVKIREKKKKGKEINKKGRKLRKKNS